MLYGKHFLKKKIGDNGEKPRQNGNWKKMACCIFGVIYLIFPLCGCSVEETNHTKVRDLDYEIMADADLPEELLKKIEEEKAANFKLTYETDEYLYIVHGYGEKETGGYSISVNDLYLTTNSIIFYTELIGPRKGETVTKSPSYPYIVVKTELCKENVIFE